MFDKYTHARTQNEIFFDKITIDSTEI
jgi:hypothetical protein